ncbi:reverse transcriptase N-terminal domain-containing protein [Nostoc sp.]|uniref:reverse transcriptase N-terminal domain-containing protein n=1 Tax=Nostoc sp. TaxID=1180 RepID=UPI002FF6E894
MIRHSVKTSESWKRLPWKKFRKTLFRLQKRVFKAVQVGDKRKARLLQKLILKSTSARFLAIRQVSQLLANIALNGIESIHRYHDGHKRGKKITDNTPKGSIVEPSIRYADDMVIILRPEDDAIEILERISEFLRKRGMNVSQKKTKVTAATDGFDFLGWHFKVQKNGKFKSVPSVDNFKAFRKKVKHIVNNSNYGAKEKAEKLSPIVRGWRNYHKFCKMDGARNSLYHIETRAYKVFNKETKQDHYSSKTLLDKAFPAVPHSENKHVMVQGIKSPYDGEVAYWSERNSKLYDGKTSKALKKQSHKCASCGLKFVDDERIHLHHIDGNHENWKSKNLEALHESCHDYKHSGKKNQSCEDQANLGEYATRKIVKGHKHISKSAS